LKEFVKINASATEIAEKLTLSGSETEKIVQHGKSLKNIVVGNIKEIKPHPDADKLRLAYVDVGKKDMLTIVCGA
ncbi:MAG: phenylalanine--tRNA ligase subunit beta, partial [Candidatus Marinimicrobia bacterium CG_4_10_14_0_2_um_filter_48_9]